MIDLKLTDDTTIAFLVDVSGGVSDKLFQNFQPIIKGNLSSLKAFTAKIAAFDHKIQCTAIITPENLSDINSFVTMGGGGTDIDPALEWCGDVEDYVVFTDGFLLDYAKLLEVKDKTTIVLYNTSHKLSTDEQLEKQFLWVKSMGFKNVIKG